MRRTAVAIIAVFTLLSPLGCVMHKTSKATFCKELRRTPSLSEVFGALTTDNPSVLRGKARRTAQQFLRLQRSAPREIRAQVSEVAGLASKVAQAVEDSNGDPQAVAQSLRAQVSDMVGSTQAALKLAEYSNKTCHYDLNNPTGTTFTTTPPSTFPFTPTTG
jgi:hypothetical protein